MGMWSITGLQLLLCLMVVHSAVVVSGITVQLDGQQYQNHSVISLHRLTTSEPLTCRATICGGCSIRTANPKWFYPDGTEVTDSTSNLLYTTGAMISGRIVTLNLYRRGELNSSQLLPPGEKGVGLYRCRIQTRGSASSVKNLYVGLYRGNQYPNEGRPIVTSVQFHLDNASTDPFQSGPPVFTLTCHSTGGPATTVTWKRENGILSEDGNYIMTRTLVEHRRLLYRNTLKVFGWIQGLFTCTVSNIKDNSLYNYRVEGANRPHDLTAVQADATTVRVSWTTPRSGGLTPSGYRIFYRPEEGQTITTPDPGPNTRQLQLTDLMPGTIYMITIVTLSEELPSVPTGMQLIAIVPAPSPPNVMASEVTTSSISFTWDDQPFVETYSVSFDGVPDCLETRHIGTQTISCRTSAKCTYNLTDLNEYSHYSITVTAVNVAGSTPANINATTLPTFPSGPPEDVRGTAGVFTITVQWDEVDCIDRNSEIVNYSLTYSSLTENNTVLVPADNVDYTIRGLRPETNYTIELAAVNTAGQMGPKGTITLQTHIPTAAPSPPTVLISEGGVTSKSISISWDEQSLSNNYILSLEGITGCLGMRHTGRHAVYCSNPKCMYNLTELNEYSLYSITVTAVNSIGNSSTTISTTTLPASPSGPPESVMGTAGVSTITVQWDEVDCIDRNSEIVKYHLTYTFTESKTVLVPVYNMTYTIRGLRPVTNYTIELAAVNTAGQVGPTATIQVKTHTYSDSQSSSDEGGTTAAIVVSACLAVTIAVAIVVAAITAKWVYTKHKSSNTADVRNESKADHEMHTTDCVAYSTANTSGDCVEKRDYEIPAVASISLPVYTTACEQVEPAIYEPTPH